MFRCDFIWGVGGGGGGEETGEERVECGGSFFQWSTGERTFVEDPIGIF